MTEKLLSVNIGNDCGEVFAKANALKNTLKFSAEVNGKIVAEGPVFEDVREVIVKMFTPKVAHDGE
jgi:hypothetical protein